MTHVQESEQELEYIDDLRQMIIEDYSNWVEQALHPLEDRIGIRNIAVENFKLKLDKLIKTVQNEKE